jgi:hypothetical protein
MKAYVVLYIVPYEGDSHHTYYIKKETAEKKLKEIVSLDSFDPDGWIMEEIEIVEE